MGQQQGSDKFAYSREGQLGLLKMVIKQEGDKFDVNALDDDGRTLLHSASSSGHLEIVEYLLSLGANPNTHDEEYWTPLMSASSGGKLGGTKEKKRDACSFCSHHA